MDNNQARIDSGVVMLKVSEASSMRWVEFNPLACNHCSLSPQALHGRVEAGDEGKRTAEWPCAPDDAETATALSLGCIRRRDLARAVTLLRKALACESYYIPARYLLGVAYLMQGRYDEAVRAFEVVVALAPQHAHAVIGLGIAYSRAGQAERAREAFAAVRRRWPDCPEVLLALARAYRAGGQPCAAVDCLARVLALASTDEDLVWRARRLLTAIEYEESPAYSRV